MNNGGPMRRFGNHEFGKGRTVSGNSKFPQTLTIGRLQEIQDLITHVGDKEFNELPSK